MPDGAPEFRVDEGESSALVGDRRIYHRIDRADLSISGGDESSLLTRLKEQVQQQLGANGCKISETGSGEGSFSIGYTEGPARGWIDIWGVRRTSDGYTLVVTITEF